MVGSFGRFLPGVEGRAGSAPEIWEDWREVTGSHTCDKRSTKVSRLTSSGMQYADHLRQRSSRGSPNSSLKMDLPKMTSYGRMMIEKRNSDSKYEVDELSTEYSARMDPVRHVRPLSYNNL
jgi:hypothetical protein